MAGKADWLSFGLPYEGTATLAARLVTTDVPTCGVGDRLGDVREALAASPFGMLVVRNDEGIVVGRLDRHAADAADDDAPVAPLMREGPATVRPSEEVEALVGRMRRRDIDAIVVTSSDGRLIGVFERRRGEAELEG